MSEPAEEDWKNWEFEGDRYCEPVEEEEKKTQPLPPALKRERMAERILEANEIETNEHERRREIETNEHERRREIREEVHRILERRDNDILETIPPWLVRVLCVWPKLEWMFLRNDREELQRT